MRDFDFPRALIAALAATSLAAAPAAAQGWALGFEGGLNVSDLSVTDDGTDVELDSEIGFRFGGVLRYDFAPDGLVGIHTGATYSRKGASDELVDLNVDYLEVPLVVAVNIPTEGAPVSPRLYAGGSFNFEANCEIAPAEGDGEAVDCDDPGADVVERSSFDFGVRFGGGVDIDVSSNVAVTLDAGYDLGLTDIDETETGEIKNRNLFFTGGFVFHP